MSNQDVVNWLLGAFGIILGFILGGVWQEIKDLRSTDKSIIDRISAIEILVAGTYVKKDEFLPTISALFDKLDRIQEIVAKKADK